MSILFLGTLKAGATRLVEMKVVDKDFLMLLFRDGEVFYRDDGTGPSAFRGHAWAEGDDTLKVYGAELDTQIAMHTSSWTITSDDDPTYGTDGQHPTAVYRKSKPMNTDAKFNCKLDHWLFLRLPSSMKEGHSYTVKIDSTLGSDRSEAKTTFDINHSLSEAIHVNIIGYTPRSAIKAADLYLWMGDGGQRDYTSFEGKQVWLYNVKSGKRHKAGRVTLWKKNNPRSEAFHRNMTGSDVWNIDFTTAVAPGRYRLVVEGVGCSRDFDIAEEVYNPVNRKARGGHSDAFDWDRHLAHVSNLYDMLLPYLLSHGRLNDDNLLIGESGNGIPDVIDEARNEVDFWLSVRDGEAYCHGLTNPSKDHTVMFQAGATTMAAWANAANCAMMADCFRLSGHKELETYYREEAIKAFEFASRQADTQLDERQDIGNGSMRGRDFKQMAAAFLYNVTGERRWEEIMAEECLMKEGIPLVSDPKAGCQIWGTAAYLVCPRERHYPELYAAMKRSITALAAQRHTAHIDKRPSRRAADNNYWQTAQNLHLVILAHFVSEEADAKRIFEKTLLLEADWGLGRNPSNMVEMTGLGERCIENCYTTGRNDGTPGLHPGHTPFNNLDTWNKSKGSAPQWFVEKCYPEWKAGGWPHQEAYFNCRYMWANGEFTPRQTMRGKMALYGYLYSLRN